MKVTGTTRHTTTLEGEVSEAELIAFLGTQIHIPEGAEVRILVGDLARAIDLSLGEPLRFRIVFSGDVPLAESPGQPGVARCSASDCRFPSLQRGLCASHLAKLELGGPHWLTTPTM